MVIHTHQPAALLDWYSQNLDFEVGKKQSLLRDGFEIILKTPEDLMARVDGYQQGFFKFGFQTNQFNELFRYLQKNEVEFVGGIIQDENLGKRSFLVKDPDGNRIQFFESQERFKLKPYFMAIFTPSIGEAEKWYQMRFPVSETHNLDHPDQKIYVRLLQGEDFAFELIQYNPILPPRSLTPGFHQVTVDVNAAPFEKDRDGNQIINP